MDKMERVASYIVDQCREIMGDAEALEFLSSPINCALYADDIAEQVRDGVDFDELTAEDFESFDPRNCKRSALAMFQALREAEAWKFPRMAGNEAREWREYANSLDPDSRKNPIYQ